MARSSDLGKDAPQNPRHRGNVRKSVELDVRVGDPYSRTAGRMSFSARDISAGGAFLRSSLLFEVGEHVEVELVAGGAPLRLRARIARVERRGDDAGMGVEFLALSEDVRARLLRLVASE